jgi:hypothetical protein
MENVEKATGYVNFDSKGQRSNYTIHIYRSAQSLPLAKVILIIYSIKNI